MNIVIWLFALEPYVIPWPDVLPLGDTVLSNTQFPTTTTTTTTTKNYPSIHSWIALKPWIPSGICQCRGFYWHWLLVLHTWIANSHGLPSVCVFFPPSPRCIFCQQHDWPFLLPCVLFSDLHSPWMVWNTFCNYYMCLAECLHGISLARCGQARVHRRMRKLWKLRCDSKWSELAALWINSAFFTMNNCPGLQWSRGSVLAFSTQVCGFKPGQSRQIFRAKKSSARLPSEGK